MALRSDVNPWHPIKDAVTVKHLGKLLEECGELTAALSRCLIQGVDGAEPVTGKPNREWLEDEISDVQAGILLCIEHLRLNKERICERRDFKIDKLRRWHKMA